MGIEENPTLGSSVTPAFTAAASQSRTRSMTGISPVMST